MVTFKYTRWIEICIFTALMFFFAGLYGFIPGLQLPSLGIWYGSLGISQSIASQPFPHWFTITDTLIPYGSPMLQGFLVYWLIAFFINAFSIDAALAGNIAGIIFLAVSFYAFVRLMMMTGIRKWVGYLCASLFLMLPYMRRHLEFGSMGIGFMLVPLSLLADLIILRDFFETGISGRKQWVVLLMQTLSVRLLIAGIDWYSAVISMVGGGVIVLYYAVRYLIEHKKVTVPLRSGIFWGVTWMAGVLPWYLSMPKSDLAEPFSMNLFRAQGIDLMTLFVPRGRFLWGRLVGLPVEYPMFDFYGDGTNVNYNYIGYSILAALVVVGVLLFRNKSIRRQILPLAIAAVLCLILSFGPSLKFDSRHQSDKQDQNQLTFEDYHMPAENAVMGLPTAPFYTIYPVSYMRAVYRWILIPKIIFLLLFGWLINRWLDEKKKSYALLLSVLAVLEFFPSYDILWESKIQAYEQYQASSASLIDSLRHYITPGERILILSDPTDGDYLAGWIVPNLKVKSFNGGGDKNNWLAMKHMPEVIRRLKGFNSRTPEEIKALMLLALRSGVVDKIVVPYFSLRWNSYDWPPDNADVQKLRGEFRYVYDLEDENINISTTDYFSVLDSKLSVTDIRKNAPEQIDSVVQYINANLQDAMFLVDGAKAPQTSLFSGRAEAFHDYRDTDSVNAAIRQGRPLYFILTAYQKYFDSENYDQLKKLFSANQIFATEDYGIFEVSPFKYLRLMPGSTNNKEICVEYQEFINSRAQTDEVSTWSGTVDFSRGDFQDQLCRGWYGPEGDPGKGFRWMGKTATLFLKNPSKPPQRLQVTIYPVLERMYTRTAIFEVRLDGIVVHSIGLTENRKEQTFSIPIRGLIVPGKKISRVTLELNNTIMPSAADVRELGVIVSKVGFEDDIDELRASKLKKK